MHASASCGDLLEQAIVHSLIAALFVEALIRAWRVGHPGQRLALRRLALAQPLLVSPALVLLFPWRAGVAFRATALLDGRSWSEVRLLGFDASRAFLGGLAALGAALFLLDARAVVRELRRGGPRAADPDRATAARIAAAVGALSRGAGGPPRISFLDRAGPAVYCAGLRRQRVVVSRGAIERLDDAELAAALAHEQAHLERRDPARSWGLLGLRALLWVSPAFQLEARVAARDAERIADERAVALGADRVALASALVKLHRAGTGRRTLVLGGALDGPLRRARSADVVQRARALLAPPAPPLPLQAARLLLAAGALAALTFLVT